MTGQQARSPAVLVPLVLVVAVAALWPSLWTLLQYWYAIQDYQHALLIMPIVLVWIGLVVRRPDSAPTAPSRGAAAALIAVLLLWLVALRASLDIAHQLLWPLALWMGIWAAMGRRVALCFAAPLGLLYSVIPVWDYLLPVLQRLSIFFSEHILLLLGVKATVTENHVTIPEGTFSIIEGCSGKRYLVVAVAIAWLSAAMNHLRTMRRLTLLFGSAVMLALVINWIRIVIIIYAGHVTNMQHYLVAVEHLTLGKLLFLPLLAGILLVARWCAEPGQAATPEAAKCGSDFPRPSRWLLVPMAAFVIVAILSHSDPVAAAIGQLGEAPLGSGGWEGPLPGRSGWMPHYGGVDDQRRLSYLSRDGSSVEVYVNLYASQRSGKELVRYGNSVVAPEGWTQPWSQSGRKLVTPKGKVLWSLEILDASRRTWLLAYTYRVGGGLYTSEAATQLGYGVRSMLRPAPAGVLASAILCETTNCDKGRTLLADFWDNMGSPIMSMLPD